MIVVTGGAGLIGSAIVWRLNELGVDDIIVVDHLGLSEKWSNLVPLRYADYFERGEFLEKINAGYFDGKIDAIFHMGACSATTERNASFLAENNYRYTLNLAEWSVRHGARFIYASSAATYGEGDTGYSDDPSKILSLRPLNAYGYSKQLFDMAALKRGWLDRIVGLKFFNVFGPNEDHKGDMRSVINKVYPQAKSEGLIKLFMSHRDGIAHGDQRRDFVYVKDAVEMALHFWKNQDAGGIYNIGTSRAQSWNEVAKAIFGAIGIEGRIEYIPMPESIRDRYQYYTCADVARLRKAGCNQECMSLDASISDYVNNYLVANKHLGS